MGSVYVYIVCVYLVVTSSSLGGFDLGSISDRLEVVRWGVTSSCGKKLRCMLV